MRIGIDLGGTKIAGIAIGKDDTVVAVARKPTPRDNYDATIAAIAAMVGELVEAAGNRDYSVGIGMPGSVSPLTGKVQNANSTWINGRAFQADVQTALKHGVRLANDANCLAVSEAHDGAGQGAASVFGVILGTGCGGGLVVNGRPISGLHSIGGEWGHNPLPWAGASELPGPACWCGRTGCLETWLSGPGLSSDHFAQTGCEISAEDIGLAAESGEKQAMATIARHLDRCGRGLAHVINILDPEVIVVGGGLSGLSGLVEGLPDAIAPHVFADAVDIRVKTAVHGPESGVRGAARLWPR